MVAHPPSVLAERYHDFRLAGEGAEGRIWRATDLRSGEPVAVKEYRHAAGRPFYQELRVASTIEHPHVLRFFEFFDLPEGRFIVWEFCSGGTLQAALNSPLEMPIGRILDMIAQVGSGLAALHRAEIIHGDIKPGNILRRRKTGPDHWKLGDFGVSMVSATGRTHRFGSPNYFAPEVLRGGRVLASDIFALGRTLEECTVRLSTATTREELDAERTLRALVSQMTHDNPKDRITAPEVCEAVRRLMDSTAIGRHAGAAPAGGDALGAIQSWFTGGLHA